MARILFRLRGVPDEEANAVRQLLEERKIAHYETPPGNWGISMPAIWLKDEAQWDEAQALLKSFQSEYTERQRALHAELRNSGQARSFLDELREKPFQVFFYIAVVLGLLYLSTMPFLEFAQG